MTRVEKLKEEIKERKYHLDQLMKMLAEEETREARKKEINEAKEAYKASAYNYLCKVMETEPDPITQSVFYAQMDEMLKELEKSSISILKADSAESTIKTFAELCAIKYGDA